MPDAEKTALLVRMPPFLIFNVPPAITVVLETVPVVAAQLTIALLGIKRDWPVRLFVVK